MKVIKSFLLSLYKKAKVTPLETKLATLNTSNT